MSEFEKCFYHSPHLLLEGALGERLKREYGIRFDRHIDMGALAESTYSRNALIEIWTGYAKTAKKYHLPFLATTPTRRTNKVRIQKSGFRNSIIHSNTALLKEIKNSFSGEMYIGALVGCYGDAYTGEHCLNRSESLTFHSWEAELFAKENIDFFVAGLMPNAQEALGMAQAISYVDIPYMISFTLNRNGCLSDGTRLNDAIEYIDNNVSKKPLCYMTNCVHPLAVMEALSHDFNQTDTVRTRFCGIQANASPLSFTELDGSTILHSASPQALARDMKALSEKQNMKIVGGCCGTDGSHIEEIAKFFACPAIS